MKRKLWAWIAIALLHGHAHANSARWKDNGNRTLTDTSTGLQWTARDNRDDVDWAGAKRYCHTLRLAGGHWRLPEVDELAGLYVDDGDVDETTWCYMKYPCKVSARFSLTSWSFWSATPAEEDKIGNAQAWHVYFLNGDRDRDRVVAAYDYRALCVRRP